MRRGIYFLTVFSVIFLIGCKKEIILSSENEILSFEIPNITNDVFVEGSNIYVSVYRNIDIRKLRPMIKVSKGARIYPPSGAITDFTYPVTYQVIAENGNIATYKVMVSNTLSNQSDIRLFRLVGTDQIFERVRDSIFIYVPYETDITNIQTYIVVTDSVTISPESGTPMNFTTPQTYTTTSTDGTKRNYLVMVRKSPWKKVRSLPYSGGDGSGVVEFKGKIWVIGGWNYATYHSQVWNSSDGVNWTRLPDAPWQPRHCAGFVVYKDAIWVISGRGYPDVWKSGDGINWTLVTDTAPWGRRYLPYVAVFKNKLWLMGGISWYDENGNEVLWGEGVQSFNDVWSSEDGENWTLETRAAPWSPRGLIHGYAVLNDELYIVGGGTKGALQATGGLNVTFSEYNDVWKTSDGRNWHRVLQHAPWHTRVHHSLLSYNGYIVVLSGSAGDNWNFTNDVWISSDGRNWKEIKYSFWQKSHATMLGGFDGKLWLLGGFYITDIWSLDFKDL